MRFAQFFRSRAGLLFLLLSGLAAHAELPGAGFRPARVFSDNMVLQRDVAVPIWGWSDADETITVEFNGQRAETAAKAGARWEVRLEAMPALAEPQQLTIRGSVSGREVVRSNVVVGDVWLCMGQSNMEMIMGFESAKNYRGILDYEQELKDTDYPNLRLLNVPKAGAVVAAPDIAVQWEVSQAASAEFFSAVAYVFGRKLNRETGVPIGLINVSMGGAPIERFMPAEVMADEWAGEVLAICAGAPAQPPSLEWMLRNYRPPAPPVKANGSQGSMYYGMISPIMPYGLKGFVWYQGESNIAEAEGYGKKLSRWIEFLRGAWGQGDLAFLAVELVPFNYHMHDALVKGATPGQRDRFNLGLREILRLPNTATVNTDDLTDDLDNIHPRNKRPVGERLAEKAMSLNPTGTKK